MELNSQGLPKAGRPLDAWIAEHVLGFRWCQTGQPFYYGGNVRMLLPPDSPLWEHRDEAVGDEPLCTLPGYYFWCPEVSTTHAFFQVMEAKQGRWLFCFTEGLASLTTRLYEPHEGGVQELSQVFTYWADYPDREHAYAHPVCCCAYLAGEGE